MKLIVVIKYKVKMENGIFLVIINSLNKNLHIVNMFEQYYINDEPTPVYTLFLLI